jgi:predicted PurR-regulated permease PerM
VVALLVNGGRSAHPKKWSMAAPHNPPVLSKSLLRWFLIAFCSVCVVYILYRNQATLVLLGMSFVVAYLLDPSIDRLAHLGLSRTLAISLLTSVVLVGLGVLSRRYSTVAAPGASGG